MTEKLISLPPVRPAGLPEKSVYIESLDLEAQGVAHREDGKVVFVEGALPFEWVSANVHRKKNNWEAASLSAVHRESSQRVRPDCPHFGLHGGACGGCKMQHLHGAAQVAVKQRVLEDNLWHLAKVRPENLLRPVEGPTLGYRYRARFSVRWVAKKGVVLVGFHERKSRYVADMSVCPILPPHVSALLLPLRELVGSMDARETCPQIELACGDDVVALVLRHLEPLSAGDLQRLRDFAAAHSQPDGPGPGSAPGLSAAHGPSGLSTHSGWALQWWLQPKGPDTVHRLDDAPSDLLYMLPEFGITMPYKPTDFTQVNPHINRVLVTRALRLLEVQPGDRVIDWFCGLGNFTLPLATQAREVLGIEGSETLVARARANAVLNQAGRFKPLAPTAFAARNLFEMTPAMLTADGHADRWLIDPPREGAFALVKALAELHQQPELRAGWTPPKRIVYVSCNPATLARDAGLLVHQAGYACRAAGVVNMFPHTAHVESVAVFDWTGAPSEAAEPSA